MEFFLRRLKLTYVLQKPSPETPSSEVTTDECKFSNEIRDTLKVIHLAEKASCNKFLVSSYMEFKMVVDRSITEQVQEFQLVSNKFTISGIAIDENFYVRAIVSKHHPSWKEYQSKLLVKKEDFTLEQLLQHWQIE
ncbi:hypothetical protein H5410_022032 [Solanum commersonii]|uniref:Uncharacterized protein n=1 Tax=Solanum commersonii TaxID=4109 RepID=A0A9J5ZFL6_SOLCO|nr:hypothetical protein H5410_022032 [Solanum commersonii]